MFFIDFQKERRVFDRDNVVSFVKRKMMEANKENLFNENTVKKDVGVLLLNYCLPRNPQSNEDFSTIQLASAKHQAPRCTLIVYPKRQYFVNDNVDICTLLEILNKKMKK